MIKKIAIALSAAFLLSGCNYTNSSQTQAPQPTDLIRNQVINSLTIQGHAFIPPTLKVMSATIVNISNKDSVPHTVTSDDGGFDSGTVPSNGTGRINVPNKPGTYSFHCSIHPDMKGVLIVQ